MAMATTAGKHARDELDTRAIRTLARTLYRRMQAEGYTGEHMVDFASTMLDLVREDWKGSAAR